MKKVKNMPWIAFLGADGSGKSTTIDHLTDFLNDQRIEVSYHHWRPVISDNKQAGSPVYDPHAKPRRGAPVSTARLFILLGVWWVSYVRDLSPLRKRGKFIIFDRFYADLLVDPQRYRYGGSRLLASCLFRLMPKPSLVMLLDAEAEVLYHRKPEVELHKLKQIVADYRKYIASIAHGVLINSDQNVERVISDVVREVESVLSE